MSLPREREFTLGQALARFNAALGKMGLQARFDVVSGKVTSAKCTLLDHAGISVDFGYGKGTPLAARVGAGFEALEHLLSQPEHFAKGDVLFVQSAMYLACCPLRQTRAIETLTHDTEGTLPFRRYKHLAGGADVLYPLALSAPKYLDARHDGEHHFHNDNFDYGALRRYSTNSGIAIGCSETEAVVHGLFEAVERHTLSLFLAETFVVPGIGSLKIVATKSLPKHLSLLVERCEQAIGSEVTLVDLTNEVDIPVIMASMSNSPFPIAPSGFGAALSKGHAATRALSELVQTYHVTTRYHPESVSERDEMIIQHLGPFPAHLRAAAMRVSDHVDAYGFESVSFSEIPDLSISGSLTDYLAHAIATLKDHGISSYTARIGGIEDLVHVNHTFLDGQDSFFCVTEGSLVVPNEGVIESLVRRKECLQPWMTEEVS